MLTSRLWRGVSYGGKVPLRDSRRSRYDYTAENLRGSRKGTLIRCFISDDEFQHNAKPQSLWDAAFPSPQSVKYSLSRPPPGKGHDGLPPRHVAVYRLRHGRWGLFFSSRLGKLKPAPSEPETAFANTCSIAGRIRSLGGLSETPERRRCQQIRLIAGLSSSQLFIGVRLQR